MFIGTEIETHKSYRNKGLTFSEDLDIDNVLVSNKNSFGVKKLKYFIGYLYDDYRIKTLYTMLLKTSVYAKSYEGHMMNVYFDWRWQLIEKM